MGTVFSYIVQKLFSQENENIATDALAFILHSNESAQTGMMKLLRGIDANIPTLQFRTQKNEGSTRPDMCGFHETDPCVFIENKFWAGLTDNQPVAYLRQLAGYTQPSILLVVCPETRIRTLWRELIQRLKDAEISATDRDLSAGIVYSIKTEIGPILALTSWAKLLSILELEAADDRNARSDLLQLRSLCEAADSEAFIPISSEVVTDQRIPAFILQLNSIIQASVDLAVSESVLRKHRKMGSQADWDGIGLYAKFSNMQSVNIWFGTDLTLWKEHGGTPLWLSFYEGDEFGPAPEVRSLLEPWAAKKGIFTDWVDDDLNFVMAVEIETEEGEEQVIRSIADRFKSIYDALSVLGSKT
ncbi:MAG: hypothetical protein ABIC40_06245 [bacterium]